MAVVCDEMAPNSTPSLERFDAKRGKDDSYAAFLDLRQQRVGQIRGKRIQLRQPRSRNLETLFLPYEQIAPIPTHANAEVPANQICRRTKNAESARRRRSQQGRAISLSRADIVRIHRKRHNLKISQLQPLQNRHLPR